MEERKFSDDVPESQGERKTDDEIEKTTECIEETKETDRIKCADDIESEKKGMKEVTTDSGLKILPLKTPTKLPSDHLMKKAKKIRRKKIKSLKRDKSEKRTKMVEERTKLQTELSIQSKESETESDSDLPVKSNEIVSQQQILLLSSPSVSPSKEPIAIPKMRQPSVEAVPMPPAIVPEISPPSKESIRTLEVQQASLVPIAPKELIAIQETQQSSEKLLPSGESIIKPEAQQPPAISLASKELIKVTRNAERCSTCYGTAK
ncbi:hypothetical protein WUBG_11202 [Wuchereria bancrofti]|uniref:Uncharacterized protein n=1 Tax=Wuchereria bancrofti TaxID=6293 RepID=J9E6F1_WUCBA|nr:hypothetical protein WUBG_11202 [Wuchereria bancrofti]